LDKFEFFGFQELLGDALGTRLGAQTEFPELFTKGSRVFIQKSGKLYLEGFYIREARPFNQVET
jgi:hypothetical protein